jgi:pyruvate dehydrogenase E2 component (dihydrolipoamide acetyltransferase)
MAKEFRLPDIGEGLAEAEIVRWLVPVGETVAMDQAVVEVETDKAVVEIPSPYAGVVLHHGAGAGEVVEVGSVLVVIGEPGERWDAGPAAGPVAAEGAAAAPIVGTISEEAVDLTVPAATPGKVQALPVVRKLARDLGVDLAAVAGSGPAGRITRQDVLAAAPTGMAAAAAPAPPAPRRGDERRPLSKLRRTIAANMSRSWAEIPHVTTFDQVDATRLLAARRALQDRHGVAVPVDALVVAAVVPALRSFPEFNATIEGDDLVVHGGLDVGIAVDTPDGLLVAVIGDAGARNLLDLAAEVRRLGKAAKERSLAPAELTGQTFTVSNIGAVGGGLGTPIVPYGTTGILSVGRAVDTPVAREGRVEVAPVMPLSLSYDHRVIDGGAGRRFMAMLLENLAEPALFLA